MNTWGLRTFDNDECLDWLDDFVASGDVGRLAAAFRGVTDVSGELTRPPCSDALAAAEIVVAARGRPTVSASGQAAIARWVAERGRLVDEELVDLARRALDRIIYGNSQLDDLWRQTSDHEAWRRELIDLRARLEAKPAGRGRSRSTTTPDSWSQPVIATDFVEDSGEVEIIEESRRRRRPEPRPSALGGVSLIISLGSISVLAICMFLAFWSLPDSADFEQEEMAAIAILGGLGILLGITGALLGLILGLVALGQKTANRPLAIVAVIISGLLLAATSLASLLA